jgi:hypothetical protein
MSNISYGPYVLASVGGPAYTGMHPDEPNYSVTEGDAAANFAHTNILPRSEA